MQKAKRKENGRTKSPRSIYNANRKACAKGLERNAFKRGRLSVAERRANCAGEDDPADNCFTATCNAQMR